MTEILAVGLGGFVGSVSRYLLSGFVQAYSPVGKFPLGTLFVNVLGCLLIGFLGGLSENFDFMSKSIRLFLFIGILGGFTTFSTFGFDTFNLFREKEIMQALIYIGGNLFISLIAVYFGFFLSQLKFS